MSEALQISLNPDKPETDRLAGLQLAFFAPGNDPRSWLHGWHPQWRDAYRAAGVKPAKDLWWPVSNAPILDLQGKLDPWRPASSRDELQAVLGSRVSIEVIPNASHAMAPEQPDAVVRAIVRWTHSLPR